MMTAKQARKMMEVYRKDYIKSEYKRICEQIKEAVENGYDSISTNKIIDPQIRILLLNLGYDVTNFTISW